MTDARADLEALAKRCESEEPSWELCIAIELATTPGAKKFLGKGPFEIEKDDRRYNPPAYCFSLDAAVSLVPDGHSWNAAHAAGLLRSTALIWKPDSRGHADIHGDAKTPALALCAAALRARAAMEAA